MSLRDCFDETIAWVLEQKEAAGQDAEDAERTGVHTYADARYEDVLGYAQIVRLLEVGREMCR
jgi:hypothetical protein